MITGGALKQEKLILTTSSEKDAKMARGGLAGKNVYISTAPYGNRTDLSTEGTNVILTKNSGTPFTYEEVRTLVKKVRMFDRISPSKAEAILEKARQRLDSRLTLFFPDVKHPTIEIGFSYNWISIEFQSNKFTNIYKIIKNIIEKNEPKCIKVFSNEDNIISIHNYAMQGIYVSRKSFEEIAGIFVTNGLIEKSQENKFALRVLALQVKSVSYMEARMLCQSVDENFDFKTTKKYSPVIGNRAFLTEMMSIFNNIFKQGSIEHLALPELTSLNNVSQNISILETHHLAETINNSLSNFAKEYKEDINKALAAK